MTRHQEREIVNLCNQDFSRIKAYATTLAGTVFFGNIEGGAVLIASGAYDEKSPTIYIGEVTSEIDGIITLSKAIVLSPTQLNRAQLASNYSPIDVLRAIYFDCTKLAPENLSEQKIKREKVHKELNLENHTEPC